MADTVIDSLVVLLKLDTSDMTAGERQALGDLRKFSEQVQQTFTKEAETKKRFANDEQKQQRDRVEANVKVAASYKGITQQVLGWAAAVISAAAITDFTKSTVQMDSGLGRFAERLDLNKEQLGLWVGMMSQISGSATSAAKSVQSAADSLNTIRFQYSIGAASGQQIGAMQVLGLTPADLQDPLQALQKIHDRIQQLHMSDRTATGLLRMLGLDDNTISLLEQNSAKFNAIRDKAAREAPSTKAQMDAAEQAASNLGRLDDILRRIAGDAGGPLADALGHVADLADKFPNVTKAVVDLVAALIVFRTVVGPLAALLRIGGGAAAGSAAAGAGIGAGGLIAGAIGIGSEFMTGPVGSDNPYKGGVATGNFVSPDVFRNPAGATDADIAKGLGILQGELADSPSQADRARILGEIGALTAVQVQRAQSGGGGAHTQALTGLAGAAVAYFRTHGVSPAASQGVGIGIRAEGGGLGMAKDGAFGIGQWRGDRLRKLMSTYGSHPTLDQQLAFMLAEMKGSEAPAGSAVLGAPTAASAARAYLARFMRPGAGLAGDFRRAGLGRPTALEQRQANGGAVQIYIGPGGVVVNTKATDARGVAAALGPELVAQASRGLS